MGQIAPTICGKSTKRTAAHSTRLRNDTQKLAPLCSRDRKLMYICDETIIIISAAEKSNLADITMFP